MDIRYNLERYISTKTSPPLHYLCLAKKFWKQYLHLNISIVLFTLCFLLFL